MFDSSWRAAFQGLLRDVLLFRHASSGSRLDCIISLPQIEAERSHAFPSTRLESPAACCGMAIRCFRECLERAREGRT
jgi:hypothetical protein